MSPAGAVGKSRFTPRKNNVLPAVLSEAPKCAATSGPQRDQKFQRIRDLSCVVSLASSMLAVYLSSSTIPCTLSSTGARRAQEYQPTMAQTSRNLKVRGLLPMFFLHPF